MDVGLNTVFLKLKPICDNIATNPTKEKLIELREIFKKSPINIIQQLHEYIIFPLYINLENKKSISNILKQELVDTLKCLLELIKLHKLKIVFQLCIAVTKQIFDKQTSTLIPSADEELKLSTVDCLRTIFSSTSNDILLDLYSKSNSIYFPQCIYLCVQIAKNEKMRDLRLNAIHCLMIISYVHDEADFIDVILRKQVADCTMFFLPGICIALRDIALDDEKQGHKITSLALKYLNKIIILHMEDLKSTEQSEIVFEFPVRETEIVEEHKTKDKNVEEMVKRLQIQTRSSEWYKKTAANLQKIIENLISLQSHYHENVRYDLSDFCHQILTKCPRNLANALSVCIEILISLSEDDNVKVSEKSRKTLELLLNKSMNSELLNILAENFYIVITKLPRIINGTDMQKQLSSLNLLVGYLKLLGSKNLLRVLQSVDHLKRFLQCLIFIATLDKSNVTVFEEYAIRDFESITETRITWKHFKYIEDAILFKKFQLALHLLARSEAIEIIVDCLSEMFLNDYEHKNEIIFLLNEIISVRIDDFENMTRIISNILKMYTEEENWYLSTDSTILSLSEIHNNIVQMCLLVEGIGNMSDSLGINFKYYLLKILYIVLERAGNAQPLLSAAGLYTLLKISQNCNYGNVTELIVQNTDYFSFHVIKKLKKLEYNTAVLDVLNVVMNYSTIDVLPSIMNIVNEVLINTCDKYQEQNILSFLRVFQTFVQNLKRWININTQNENKIIKLLNDYKNNMDVLYAMYETNVNLSDNIMNKSAKELFEEDMTKSKEELENEYSTEDDEKKVEPPEYIKLTVAVLKRSLNFLPSKIRERKITTINILVDGIIIIKDWENELLPLIHLIWSPLIDRFKEYEDPLIINKSLDLLIVLAKLSKDFIRSRTSQYVLPELCFHLETLSNKSYLKDRGSAYRYNQEYKLQLNILNNIADLSSDLEMSTKDINLIMQASFRYLSFKQPLPLQESVINCYKTLACYDFDTVWLYLIEMWGSPTQRNETKCNEFSKNTELVLKQLDIIHGNT